MPEPHASRLRGRRLLVVEDEYLIASDLTQELEGGGAEVIGPAATVEEALQLTASEARIDGAVLDINLRGKEVYPVAEVLRGLDVPFIFATGYDDWNISQAYADVPRLEKPVDMNAIARLLAERL